MSVIERLRSEQAFHDRQATERAAFFRKHPGRLLVSDDQYLNHESWIRPALASFGNVAGRQFLDFGCGHGMAAVILAKRGARVTAFDLSSGYLDEARARAAANCVPIDFIQANGEALPFADETFDCVWGNAILHHLDLKRTGLELRRVLKAGGMAVFCEPWGGNPLLNLARKCLTYPGKERTPNETPLTSTDVKILHALFPKLEITGQQLLSMMGRMISWRQPFKTLDRLDKHILTRLPFCRRWCRYVVVTLRK